MTTGRLAGALVLAVLAAGCGPRAPAGADKAVLDAAVSRAIGDPNTCLLIGERGSGRLVYRYNTHMVCARSLPACEGEAMRTVGALLKATAADGGAQASSCASAADRSRSVGWAAGPVEGRPGLVYAAMMEGDRSLPGRVMTERLARAFGEAGLSGSARKAR